MPLNRNNYYNPFTDSFLGAFVPISSLLTNASTIILEDVDLYYQPVPNPILAGIFSAIVVIILIFGLYLHLEVLLMLKKEGGILKNITKIFIFAQITLWTVNSISVIITNFVHTFPPMIVNWICPLIWILIYFSMNLVTFHSFVSATMRYLYIVHTKKVDSFGKERMKKLFLVISVLIPLVVTIWKAMDGSELDSLSYINKCYGKHHKVFLIETSTANVFKKNFCEVANYSKLKGYEQLKALGQQIFCVASTTTMLIMGSNITEGFIYYKLFSYMNR